MVSKDVLVENMDLIGGYLLVLLILFAANVSLLMGNYKLDNFRIFTISAAYFISSTAIMLISTNFFGGLSFMAGYFSYLFLALSIAIFIIIIYYSRGSENLKNSIVLLILLWAVSMIALSSNAELSLIDMLTYSLFGFIIMFLTYKLSKLLVHAKRDYPVIVREFMCLSAILMLIFALTYNSTMTLDYRMFNPFLILTPTYKVIYVVIGVIAGVIIGFVLDDNRGGNS